MTEWTLQLEKEPNDKMQTKPTVNLKLKGYSINPDEYKHVIYNSEKVLTASLFTEQQESWRTKPSTEFSLHNWTEKDKTIKKT